LVSEGNVAIGRLRRITLVTSAGLIVATVCTLASGQATAPAPAARPAAPAARPAPQARPAATGGQMPRTPEGKPDFSGIWQALNGAAWDIQDHNSALAGYLGVPPGKGIVEGNEIPYKADALAQKKRNFEKRDTEDPAFAKCYLPGIPRANYMPYPFEIVQNPDRVGFRYEFARATRTVDLTGRSRAWLEGWPDFWMGDSRGKWEGDTLVVDVRKLDERSWFDHAGNFHTENLHVVERYSPLDRDHIQYEATMEDPEVFTRPWKISFLLYRVIDKHPEIFEWDCRFDQDSAKYKAATPK
jgi:hypothetical protein